MTEIEKLVEKLNEVDVEVNFKPSDMRKFFYLAVLANMISYVGVGAIAGFALVKIGQKAKKNEEKNGPTSIIKT